jgi:F-type H+-transporting ATPase subunit epsilon
MGDVGIAPRHAPLLTNLRPGDLRIQTPDGEEKFFFVTGGVLEVQPHLVTVLADSALRGDDLNEEAARLAQETAQQRLAGVTDQQDLAHARQQLIEASARYQAVQKMKGRKG